MDSNVDIITDTKDATSDIDWENLSQGEMEKYAMISLRMSTLSSVWATRSLLSRSMLKYSLFATAVLVIGYKLGYEPMLLAFLNLIAAAFIAGIHQLTSLYYEGKLKDVMKEHQEFVLRLSRKRAENNT